LGHFLKLIMVPFRGGRSGNLTRVCAQGVPNSGSLESIPDHSGLRRQTEIDVRPQDFTRTCENGVPDLKILVSAVNPVPATLFSDTSGTMSFGPSALCVSSITVGRIEFLTGTGVCRVATRSSRVGITVSVEAWRGTSVYLAARLAA
jgi:hypothetical protein